MCTSRIDFFVRLTVSAVEAPNVTRISISELQRSVSGDSATGNGMCLPFIAFHLIAKGLTVCLSGSPLGLDPPLTE